MSTNVNFNSRRRRLCAIAVFVSLVSIAASGCSAASSDSDVLTVWQFEQENTAQYQAWQRAVEIFEESHPEVTVDLQTKSFDSIAKNSKLLLSGNDVPDVMLSVKGSGSTGQLAAQGLLEPLTDEAEERGWDEKVTGSVQLLSRYDELGNAGSGDWYGVPNYGEYHLFYYNKDAFAAAGLSVPTSMSELETVFDSFLASGITPVSSEAGEWDGIHTWYQLVASEADRQTIDDYDFLKPGINLTHGAFEKGTERFEDWIEKGYLGTQLAALTSNQMETAFLSGDFPIMASGSWSFNRISSEAPFDWGLFEYPGSKMTLGGPGGLWVVPSGAKDKDLAYDWIDITLSPEVQNEMGSLGGLPIASDPSQIEDEQVRQLTQYFQDALDEDTIAGFPDSSLPGAGELLTSNIQSMVNGSMTSSEFLEKLQEFYDTGVEQAERG